MVAIGCMLPIFVLVPGAGLGGLAGGTKAGLWGGAVGFAVGIILNAAGHVGVGARAR